MIALVMCGGRGRRLGMGEKPMVRVGEKRLIDYVLDELWFCDVYGVTTKFTPNTERYLVSQGIRCIRTSGGGYMEDYTEAILRLGICEPVLIVSADLVILEEGLILKVVDFYFSTSERALKVVDGSGKALGINVIDGLFVDSPQDEVEFVTNKVININTPQDMVRALCSISKRKGGEW